MHIEDLKAALRKKGATQESLAAAVGISRSYVSMALRTGSSSKLNAEVSRLTGMSAESIWPVDSRAVPRLGKSASTLDPPSPQAPISNSKAKRRPPQ